MKRKILPLLLFFAMANLLSAQNIGQIKSIPGNTTDKMLITLDKTFSGEKKVKISGNIIELPISAGLKKFPGEVGEAMLFYEGKWLKIKFPQSYLTGYQFKSTRVTIRAIEADILKSEIRKLIKEKKYKSAIGIVQKIIGVNDSDGETWYLGGVIREKMGDAYKAKINYNKSKKYGYDPRQKKVVATQTETKTSEKVVSVNDSKDSVIPPKKESDDWLSFFFWPLIIIGVAVIVMLYFLFGQKKNIEIEDDEVPENFNAALKKSAKEPVQLKKNIPADVKEKEPQKPADFAFLDHLQDENDPDATIVFDGDLNSLDPEALSPKVDFDKEYPVLKNQSKEEFNIEEEEILDSVVNDIQRKDIEKNKPVKKRSAEDTRKLALQIARQRLMEIGSEKCRVILFKIDKGESFAEIANQNDVSISDVELVNKYLKIGS